TSATPRNAWYAVWYTTPNAAASAALIPSGTRRSAAAGAHTSCANAPTMPVPATASPGASVVTLLPTDSTVPAYSLPGMNGGGTDTWYLFATMSTSGELR